MKGLEFLATADKLAHQSLESDWRSAVSRAYYAVFHHLREIFLLHGLDLGRSGQAHFNLYAGLLHHYCPVICRIVSTVYNRAFFLLVRRMRLTR